jgi:polysaccharide export outer membrane protein
MPPTLRRLSSAAALLLAFVAALSGQNQNFSAPDTTSQPPASPGAGSIGILANWPGLQAQPEADPLGPGDLVTIHVLEAEDSFRHPVRISANGALHLPMAGRFPAAGLTVAELEARLTERLKAYVHEPHVAVNIVEYGSRPVMVMGAVQNPGVRMLTGEKTLLELLSESGGVRPEAGPAVRITRRLAWGPLPLPSARPDPSGRFSIAEVRLNDVLDGEGAAQNLAIRPQDIISVPRAEMIYVVGAVRQASGFVLEQRHSLSVLEALALAGGLAPKAAPQRAVILRPGEEESSPRVQVAVNLKNVLAGQDPDLALGSEDVLYVPYSGAKIAAEKAVNAAITIGTGLLIWRR